ncbi:MAG: SDR family oxidoreductase [Bacteroidetes bacterium]|nr:SDR family oxidoreductase [Bacteroidota bacterium]
MKLFIIGASGLVGSHCLRYFKTQGCEVLGSYKNFEQAGLVCFDTLNPKAPGNFDLAAWQPEVIVHCGALTHVDYCETHEEESYQQSVQSTQNLIAIANLCGARMVYMSTDYVFDGTDGPYLEDAVTKPLSVYGRHKLEAEQAVMNKTRKPLVLRITNVYGDEARGKNFIARIINQCIEKQHLNLNLPFDQYANPTQAADIARALFLLLRDSHEGIFNICGSDYMNRVSLALRVLKYFPDASYELTAVSTASLNQAALRPLLGGFINRKFSALYPKFLFSTVDDFLAEKTSK